MNVLVRSFAALTVVAGVFLFAVPLLLRPFGAGLVSVSLGGFSFFGIIPIVLGATILYWCALTLALRGKGTPAPFDPPKMLVAVGPYRIVRNPMYLGAELVLIGEAVALESPAILVYAAILWLTFHLLLVTYEEPSLRRRFGGSYERYCEAVPRWLPRFARLKRD